MARPTPLHQEVSAGLSRGTEQWLGWHRHTQLTAAPGRGCARLLALVSQCCMDSVGTFIPGTNPALPGPSSRRKPWDSPGNRARQQQSPEGVHVLVNSCMTLKFGAVFLLESSAQGQWELWCHLGFPRTSSPQSQHVPRDGLCPAGGISLGQC